MENAHMNPEAKKTRKTKKAEAKEPKTKKAEAKEPKTKKAEAKEPKTKKAEAKEPKTKKAEVSKRDCDICADSLADNKFIACPYCEFVCCKKCVERFLLGLDEDVPRCMNTTCKKVWSMSFLANNFTKTFCNKQYRDRRSALLMEREKSLLPDAQVALEDRKRKEKIDDQISSIENEITSYKSLKKHEKDKAKKKELNSKIAVLKESIEYLYISKENKLKKKQTKQVIMQCPMNECRGFVNSENEAGINKCGVCDVVVCKKCRVVKKSDSHECDKDVLETIKMLSKDTKNCPNCTTPIFKINGCDQMYCTQCHTAFSWTKGTIEKGVVHNPHFYEYQRRINNGVIPRVAGDNGGNECGVERWNTVDNILRQSSYNHTYDNTYRKIETVHRMIGHIDDYAANLYTLYTLDLRLDYLDQMITEKQWLETLKRRQKKHEKDAEVRQVLRMVVDTFSDVFRMFTRKSIEHISKPTSLSEHFLRSGVRTGLDKFVDEFLDSIQKVCDYANDALTAISKQYDNVVPYFAPNFYMYQTKSFYPTILNKT
jgi:hypothetical protein